MRCDATRCDATRRDTVSVSVRGLAFVRRSRGEKSHPSLIKRPVSNNATPLGYQIVVNHSGVEFKFCRPILSVIKFSGLPILLSTLNTDQI